MAELLMAFEDPIDRYGDWLAASIREDRAHMLPSSDGAAMVEATQLVACALTEIAQLLEHGINVIGRIAEDHRPGPAEGVWKEAREAVERAIANPEVMATGKGVVAGLHPHGDRVEITIDVEAIA